MRVLQLGGDLARRYSNELYENTVNNKQDISIDHRLIEAPPVIGSAIAFPIQTFFTDFDVYDIVHNVAGCAFFPQRKGDAIIVTSANEMQPVLYPEITPLLITSLKDLAWQTFAVKPTFESIPNSDYIIANSKLTARGVRKMGFPKSRIFTVQHGLDRRFYAKTNEKKVKKAFVVGTLGTISPHKNTFFSIDAFKRIEDKNVRFDIWGKSLYSVSKLEESIAQDKRIRLMGSAPEKNIVDIYDSFDVFLFPSLFEGFGMPIIEAITGGASISL